MCWKCDHPGSTVEDYFDELRATIRAQGWAVQFVESDRTPYAYTIGLHDWDVPELLVTGVSPQRAVRLLNRVARDAVCGEMFAPGQQITIPAGPLIEIVKVARPDAHMNFAVAFGGPEVRALQLVWADGRGAILLGKDDQTVIRQLSGEFPMAVLIRDRVAPRRWTASIEACQREDPLLAKLTLEFRVRVFQARVWKNLAGRSG